MSESIKEPEKIGKAHYVNNQSLLKAIIQYKKDCKEAKRNSEKKPKVPEYVGKCLLLIAENLSHKPNFINYSFREEMIGDAIENCFQYFDNFDPKKSKNPFAYFTQITYYAFLRRIHKEKKQLYTKYKIAQQSEVLSDSDFENDGSREQFEVYDNISEFIGNYEASKKMGKGKKKKKVKNKVAEAEEYGPLFPEDDDENMLLDPSEITLLDINNPIEDDD